MNYLKPNFSNHPMNWLSLVFVFFASFYSVSSLAAPGDYEDGYYYEMNGIYQYSDYTHQGLISQLKANEFSDSCWDLSTNGSTITATCSNGSPTYLGVSKRDCTVFPYSQRPLCLAPYDPPVEGCDYESSPQDFYVKIPSSTEPSQMYGTKIVSGGCVYAPQQTETEFTVYKDSVTGDFYLKETYIPYVDYDESQHQNSTEQALTLEDLLNDTNQLDDDSRVDSSNTALSDPVETSIDGVTTKIEQKTETTQVASGTVVESDNDSVVVTEYGGIRKTETTTTTTITNADGSQEVIEVVDTAYTQVPGQKVTYNTDTSSVTWTDISGATSGKTKTTSTIYDSEGNAIGTSVDTSYDSGYGSGSSNSDSLAGEVKCQQTPDALECTNIDLSEIIEESVDQSSALAAAENSIASVLDGYENTVTDGIESAVSDSNVPSFMSLSNIIENVIPNSSACIPLTYSAGGHSFVISCDFSNYFKQIFGWILYVLTLYSIFYIAVFGLPSSPQGAK